MKLWEVHLHGLRLLRRGQGVFLYRIQAGPVPPTTITVLQGFNLERPFLPHVERYMLGSMASLGIQRLGGNAPLRIRFHARSYRVRRRLKVFQAGILRWQGLVGIGINSVTITTASDAPLRLVCAPGAVHVRGFGNRRSVLITNFSVESAR